MKQEKQTWAWFFLTILELEASAPSAPSTAGPPRTPSAPSVPETPSAVAIGLNGTAESGSEPSVLKGERKNGLDLDVWIAKKNSQALQKRRKKRIDHWD